MLERLAHPEVGAMTHMGIPWRVAEGDSGEPSPAPCLGADTDRVLATHSGMPGREIADLRTRGVLI